VKLRRFSGLSFSNLRAAARKSIVEAVEYE
jgi:hypothetical protein